MPETDEVPEFLYVWMEKDENGDFDVVAAGLETPLGGLSPYPLVTVSLSLASTLAPLAQEIAKERGQIVQFHKFRYDSVMLEVRP